MKKTLCITWFHHRRTTELCDYLGIPLFEIVTGRRGVRRYMELSIRTWCLLRVEKPRVLLIQSPSIILSFIALLLKSFFKYKLVVDAHNEAVDPFSYKFFLIKWLAVIILNRADRIIVTNNYLANIVNLNSGVPLILHDRIPRIPELIPSYDVSEKFNIAVVATFAADEPIFEIFNAASRLNSECHFYVTGNSFKIRDKIKNYEISNITFCGFVPDLNYWGLLKSCDLVLDLTVKDNCLVCGAYEAVAVGTPMLLSDNQASLDLFKDIAIFTDNSADSIVLTIKKAISTIGDIRIASINGKVKLENLWHEKAETVRFHIENLSGIHYSGSSHETVCKNSLTN